MPKLRPLAVLALLSSFSLARAEEGMFTFDSVPREDIKKKYGFDITDAWLLRAQHGAVRFDLGGSGSFVSAHGLVMTNQHVASDALQKLSTPEKDLMKNGFIARKQSEELQAPDMEVDVLVSMRDVTAQILAAVKPGLSTEQSIAARHAAIAEIERKTKETTGLKGEVVSFYRGAQYGLYSYKTYDDVRLVFAPELAIAGFGGDPDNFNYPRYDLDMSFFRIYENGKPLDTPDHFKWSKTGAVEGELLFVAGHPGSTSRLDTVAHLAFLREVSLPFEVKELTGQRVLLQGYSKRSEEHARRAKNDLLEIENDLKETAGELAGLQSQQIMARKIAAEGMFRERHAEEFKTDDPFEAIARSMKKRSADFLEQRFIGREAGFDSTLFGYALTLVRMAEEDQKPDGQRRPEFTIARRSQLEADLFSTAPLYEDLEKLKLAGSIKLMQEQLGEEHPVVKAVLNDGTPALSAVGLIEGSKLHDVAVRKGLATGGAKAIAASKDPLIVLAKMVAPRASELQNKYENEIESVERTAYERIARAQFNDAKAQSYPDATFTLRLSYGEVKGYTPANGTAALEPHTNFAGLYQRAEQYAKDPDFELPARWIEKKAGLALETPFNFVSTNDIVGGNSGSPVFNKDEEIVGLIFDGNIESIVGDFIYDETQNRAVAVDSRGIMEALDKMYGAVELIGELKE